MLSKRMFRKLGLSVVAIMGLAAFFAGGAQAVAGEFKVLGSAALATGETVGGSGGLTVLVIAPINIEIHCEKYTESSAAISSGPAGSILAKILYENCVIKSLSPLEELSNCVISNGGANRHATITAIILAELHNGVKYLLVEQDGATPLFRMEFTKGIGCTLPNPVEGTGTYTFETSQSEVLKPIMKPGNEALQTLLGSELKFGKSKTILTGGSGTLELLGAHKGCSWGAV